MYRRFDMQTVSNRFGLTQRETDVVRHVFKGLRNADIATNLVIAEQTVKDHLSKAYKKIGVRNRFELMRVFMRESSRKVLALSKNVSELKLIEKELRDAVLTDDLTGLYNRKGFVTLVDHYIRIAERQKRNLYLLFADVDDLKAINDVFGHGVGDETLRNTANILKNTFRESDIVARVGGDEFIAIPIGSSQRDVNRVVSRLQRELALFNSTRNSQPFLSISYGVSCYCPERPCSVEELLLRADQSMYEQKRLKKRSQ